MTQLLNWITAYGFELFIVMSVVGFLINERKRFFK